MIKTRMRGEQITPEINGWYNNLKKQFQELDKELSEKETEVASCRITGAMLKKTNKTEDMVAKTWKEEKMSEKIVPTHRKPERTLSTPVVGPETPQQAKVQRHYFSKLVRSSKSLIDEELPDPDKVHNIRAMFQEQLRLRKPEDRWGGSLQNINLNSVEATSPERPRSAQGGRSGAEEEEKIKKKPQEEHKNATKHPESVSLVKRGHDKESQTEDESKRQVQEQKKTRWTDSGSMSSGVSSDLSSCDVDIDWMERTGTENSADTVDGAEEPKHYVQHEILERIRSFGTSVTYFGGEMVRCSVGPLLSPTTQAIMEEIGHTCPNSRTFDEFYRKYTETNENGRNKKKISRTRSFGQNDLFQKPNVLNDTEIEIYKKDLELEFGIRRPRGKQPNAWRNRLAKAHSVAGCPALEVLNSSEPMETMESDKTQPVLIASKIAEVQKIKQVDHPVNKDIDPPKINEIERPEMKDIDPPEIKEIESPEMKDMDNPEIKEIESPEMKEITFGYDKKLLNLLKKTDMEFEEFQIAETAEEKIERLEESIHDYRVTIHINGNEEANKPTVEIEEPFEEIVIPETDQPDSLEMYLKPKEESVAQPKRKWNIDLNQEVPDIVIEKHTEKVHQQEVEKMQPEMQQIEQEVKHIQQESVGNQTSHAPVHIIKPNEPIQSHSHHFDSLTDKSETESENPDYENVNFSAFDFNRNSLIEDRKFLSKSLWPIETTVVIDIQKQDITTPKMLTSKESKVKTTKRVF